MCVRLAFRIGFSILKLCFALPARVPHRCFLLTHAFRIVPHRPFVVFIKRSARASLPETNGKRERGRQKEKQRARERETERKIEEKERKKERQREKQRNRERERERQRTI